MKIWRQVLCRSHNWKACHFKLLTGRQQLRMYRVKKHSEKLLLFIVEFAHLRPCISVQRLKEITVLSSCGILIAARKIYDLHCPHTLLQMKLKFNQIVSVCIWIIRLGLGYCFLSPCGLQLRGHFMTFTVCVLCHKRYWSCASVGRHFLTLIEFKVHLITCNPGARFSKVPTLFGWHSSLCIFKAKASRNTKICTYFNFYSLYEKTNFIE